MVPKEKVKDWLDRLDKMELRDRLMVNLAEEDGCNSQACLDFQAKLNNRYQLLKDLIRRQLPPKPIPTDVDELRLQLSSRAEGNYHGSD
jgi:hypothetical protein